MAISHLLGYRVDSQIDCKLLQGIVDSDDQGSDQSQDLIRMQQIEDLSADVSNQ